MLYLIVEKYNRRSAMAMVTVSQKGWVVIPVALRNKYRWNTGDRVQVVDYGGVVSLVPVPGDPEEEGRGALSMRGRSLLRRLRQTRKAERRRDKTRK
jgi:AbrB family looped-hinge helix DNA binding protein